MPRKPKHPSPSPENDAERSAAVMTRRFAKVDEACRKHPDATRQFDVALAAHDRPEIERLWDWLEAQD